MPRRLRLCLPNVPVHIVHRGNDRKACFWEERDYVMYLGLLEELAPSSGCEVHAYVLMTNHVHLLATPLEGGSLSRMMKNVGQRYTQFINRNRSRTGSLWEGRFRSSMVDTDGYFLRCQRYIELNPVRAAMVPSPAAYRWSSFLINATGMKSAIIKPHPVYAALGATDAERLAAYGVLFEQEVDPGELDAIRNAVNGGFPWGSEEFVDRLESELGLRTARKRRPNRLRFEGAQSEVSGLTPV